MNNLTKYNFILLTLIEILYNFRTRKVFNLLRLKDFNAIKILKTIYNASQIKIINIIIIYFIIKSIIRIIKILITIILTLITIIRILFNTI